MQMLLIASFSCCILQLTKAHFKKVFNYSVPNLLLCIRLSQSRYVLNKLVLIIATDNYYYDNYYYNCSKEKLHRFFYIVVANPYRVQPSPKKCYTHHARS